MSLPKLYVERMQKMLGEEADDFLRSYDEPKATGIRVNTLKIEPDGFAALSPFAVRAVPFCPTGFYTDAEAAPGKHPYHQAGLYYVQEPSAMFVGEVVDAKPGEKVLDLCAAPGGKTTHIAAKMNGRGLLIANDVNAKRVRALSENIERLGITNAIVTNETPERLASRFGGFFDRVLVDAPCSGEGMFRKDPEAIQYWSPDHVAECAAWQRDILEAAYRMLREGGTLVYSTCTFAPEENEAQIAAFLDHHPDMCLVPVAKPDGVVDARPEWSGGRHPEIAGAARLWPHRLEGEGHFVAKLVKTGGNDGADRLPVETTKIDRGRLAVYRAFERETLTFSIERPLVAVRDHLFALPEGTPKLDGLKVIRPGLHLGTFKKKRFEPNHALAMALKSNEARHTAELSRDGDAWRKYLRGETLATGGNRGWTLVTIEGFPLGWGKEVQGTLKNFYPKGLRIFGA